MNIDQIYQNQVYTMGEALMTYGDKE